MPRLQSKTQKAILRDQGAPQRIDDDEQMAGAGMDDVSRDDFPEIEDISVAETSPEYGKAEYSGVKRKSGQIGTT